MNCVEQAAVPHPSLHIAMAVGIGAAPEPCWWVGHRGKVSADSIVENIVPLVAPVLLLPDKRLPDPLLTFIVDEDEDTLTMSPPCLTKMGEKIML